MYQYFFKRVMDITLSVLALLLLSPVLLLLPLVGAIAMRGNPFFVQLRPGKISKKTGKETIFPMIKLRTMSNKRDANGDLLPDEERLTAYGRFLRRFSLDELFELVNILKGDMSLVGPRPQLVRDMVFMTDEQRKRHTVLPGLTGLAQCNGRNSITWEKKLAYDLSYIESGITLLGDVKILFKTAGKMLRSDDVNAEGMATSEDLGDYLLRKGVITQEEYDEKQAEANELLAARKA